MSRAVREAVQRLGDRFLDCEAYETVDGYWVVAVPAGRFEPDERHNHFEARMKGAIQFSELQGVITLGPTSLILFKNNTTSILFKNNTASMGGQIMSSALVEVII